MAEVLDAERSGRSRLRRPMLRWFLWSLVALCGAGLVAALATGLRGYDRDMRDATECVGRQRPSPQDPCAPVRNVKALVRP